eukprot:EG_transcript_6443
MSFFHLLLAALLPFIVSAAVTWGGAVPGTYTAGYLPRPLKITFTSDSTLGAGDNVTIVPHTQAGGSANAPGTVFSPSIPTVGVSVAAPTSSGCSAAGVTDTNSVLTVMLSSVTGSTCNLPAGTAVTLSVTTSLADNVYGDTLLFDLGTTKDATILLQPGWSVTYGLVSNNVQVFPTSVVAGVRSQYYNVQFVFTAPLVTGSLVNVTASAAVFLPNPSSTPSFTFSASCAASYNTSTATSLTVQLSLNTASIYTSCSVSNFVYMAIPQAYVAANPTGGTAVTVNVATALPPNNQSTMAVAQYTTTSPGGLNVIQLATLPPYIVVNTTFSAKNTFKVASLNNSFIINTTCDGSTKASTYTVFSYQSAGADSHANVCLLLTQFTFTNCSGWNITHSCQGSSTTAHKFRTLDVGSGTITETFTRTSTTSGNGGGSSSGSGGGGSDTGLLWLLWLLLLPLIPLAWWGWRRWKKSRQQMEKHDSLLSPRHYPNPMDPEAGSSAAAAASSSFAPEGTLERSTSSGAGLPVPSSTPVGQHSWISKEAAS